MLQLLLLSSFALAQETQTEAPVEPPAEETAESTDVAVEAPVEAPVVTKEAEAAPVVTEEILHRLEAAAFYKVGLELVVEGQYDDAAILFGKLSGT